MLRILTRFLKVFVVAALFAAVLFGVSAAVDSEPAAAQVTATVNRSACEANQYIIPSATTTTTFTVDFVANGCLTASDNQYFCRFTRFNGGNVMTSVVFTGTRLQGTDWRNSCRADITVRAGATGSQTFVAFLQADTQALTATIRVTARPAANLRFSQPPTIQMSTTGTIVVDASQYATETHSSYTISCGNATSVSSKVTVTRSGCDFTVESKSGALNLEAASFTVPYMSSGGGSQNGTINLEILASGTNINLNAPTLQNSPRVAAGSSKVVDVSSWASIVPTVIAGITLPAPWSLECSGASTSSSLVSISARDGCLVTFSAGSTQGDATFSVTYRHAGGITRTASSFPVRVGPASVLAYQAPSGLQVGRNRVLTVNASSYATDGAYSISCGAPENIDTTRLTSVAQQGSSCNYRVTPDSALSDAQQGNATFDIPFTSAGGPMVTGTVTVDVGPDSTITVATPESNPVVLAGGTSTVDFGVWASEADSGWDISCGTATAESSESATITVGTATGTDGCSFPLTASSTEGTVLVIVPFSSTGGHSATGRFLVNVQNSNIAFNGPSSFSVAAGREQVFFASASDGGFEVSCGEATGVDTAVITVTRNGCFFTVAAAASATEGDTTFSVRLMSSGGSTHDQTFTITVGAASSINFEAPTTPLSVPAGNFRHFDVSGYASDGDYGITCRYSGALHELVSRLGFVAPGTTTPTGPASGCNVTIYAGDTAGSGSVSVIYNSAGGDEVTGVIPVVVASSSALDFSPPRNLSVRIERAITVNARLYARDGLNTITCGDAEAVSGSLTGVVRDGCFFTATAGSSTGSASFTVPYTSSSGAELKGRIDLTINEARSDIDFTAPAGLSVAANGIITIDAADYASDGIFTVSCETITQSHTLISSINESGCSIRLTAGGTAGTAAFEVPYISSGGDTHDGQFTLTIGDIPALSASGCTDGTFVDTTENSRVVGSNNDLVEDCQALVAAQNHWAGVAANNDLRSSYFLRTWGTGTAEQRKIDMWEGVTVSGGRVTDLEIDNLGEEDGISGTIPAELGDLAALTLLDISSHQLSGSIPAALGSLTGLTSLDLSGNALSSEIPAQLGSLTALTSLDLSRNALSGNIPSQLGSLTSLTGLSLDDNELTGEIPTQLGSLSGLVSLFLGGNRLTGSVPSQLGTITTLTSLGICSNYLTGALPSALRSGVALLGYDTSDGYNPVACQVASDIQFSAPHRFPRR